MTDPDDTPPPFVPYVPGPAPASSPLQRLADPPTLASTPPPRRNRTALVAVGVLGVVVLLAVGVVAGVMLATGKGPFGSKTFTAKGTVTLLSEDDYAASRTCNGKDGFADIREGAAVTVSDAAGATVALGQLGAGSVERNGCTFPFSVANVPTGKGFYGIEVEHRGVLRYSEADITSGTLTMSLG